MLDTHRFLHFNLTHTGTGEDNHYIDIGLLLSRANRRFYRQGMNYHVANIVFDDSDGDADIDVCTLPNTWMTQAAWQKGFQEWNKQQVALEKASGVKRGKWLDFRIDMTKNARDDVDNINLIDANGNTFPVGDSDYSRYQIANDSSNVIECHDIYMMGSITGSAPDYTGIGLLECLEWALGDDPQEDPDLHTHFDILPWQYLSGDSANSEVNEEVAEDWEEFQDNPPYNALVVPGADTAGSGRPSSPWVVRSCKLKTGALSAAVGGFTAPCGLLMIESDSSTDGNSIGVTIELTPGDYKGVHAWPMRGGGE